MSAYIMFSSVNVLLSGHLLLKMAAHSVDHMFSLYFDCFWFWLFPNRSTTL